MKRIFVVFIVLTATFSKNIGGGGVFTDHDQVGPEMVAAPKVQVNKPVKPSSGRNPLLEVKVLRISGYTLHPAQTDSSPYVASCGSLIPLLRKNIKVFAVSRDIFFKNGRKWLCGRRAVLRYGNGKVEQGVVFDTMSPRYQRAVDVLVHRHGYSQAHLIKVAYTEYGVTRTGTGTFIVY